MLKDIQNISSIYFKRFQDLSINIDINDFHHALKTIIVIPCFKERGIIETLISLSQCDIPKNQTQVLILINAGEQESNATKDFNKKTFLEIENFIKSNSFKNLGFKVFLNNEMPHKFAGVGLARKILMDTAFKIFSTLNHDGLIVNTDADCLFSKNYLTEIENSFSNDKVKHGVIHFEHRIDEEKNKTLAKGIVEYELHLRYYKQALQWANYPNVMHNIGSCMICRASIYGLEGGMNKRKAGEDFYFMNKLAKKHPFVEVKNASVLPSCRISDRVPFGTGKAMNDYLENKTIVFQSYNFECFINLKKFIENIDLLYLDDFFILKNKIYKETFDFFISIGIENNLSKIKKQSKDLDAFRLKFFYWFDHLKALQFIHYYTDKKFRKININKSCLQFLKIKEEVVIETDCNSLLNLFRTIDKL